MSKVLKRDVDAAAAEYGAAVARWGEHNLETVCKHVRYWELREQWEAQTGKDYGAARRGKRTR